MSLRVVFYYQSDRWIAHCLEFDLMGDGDTQVEALASLSEAISLQVEASLESSNLENLFSPADGRYLAMFAKGRNVAVGQLDIHATGCEFEGYEVRVFEGDLQAAAT
ncbi:MAG: hypothetical protein KDA58_10050 [Planctomycetaceae bacterium]|nr:hypothetical protein [Planctomycetaceae bacterium]